MLTHYDALGVTPHASQLEIRKAYRHRILAAHPDKGGCHEDFLRVKQAFDVLCHSARSMACSRSDASKHHPSSSTHSFFKRKAAQVREQARQRAQRRAEKEKKMQLQREFRERERAKVLARRAANLEFERQRARRKQAAAKAAREAKLQKARDDRERARHRQRDISQKKVLKTFLKRVRLLKKATFKKKVVGQLVQMRDRGGTWYDGYITSLKPLEICFKKDGPSGRGYRWSQARAKS